MKQFKIDVTESDLHLLIIKTLAGLDDDSTGEPYA